VRDQGFTRPKVLILAPMRNVAYEIVNLMVDLSGTDQHENKRRFKDEYFSEDDPESSFQSRPSDYQRLFRGNTDDCFKIGLKFTRKTMKLYSQFYQSDIIVASPLGLRLLIEGEKDFDFLSSIEILIVDNIHVMSFQNWEHVQFVLEHLNQIPKQARDCDFSRIKAWYLDGMYVADTFSVFLRSLKSILEGCSNVCILTLNVILLIG
jgi:U3 small nucleolar RNA-associated protein 25